MNKRKFPVILALGLSLIVLSLAFAAILQIGAYTGYRKSLAVAAKIEDFLPDHVAGTPGMYSDVTMPSLEIDGTDYVALIEIPSFDVTIPVTNDPNSNNLFTSPSRFCGSTYDHTLVIGGADISHQFAFCDEIEIGALVTVTDMTGAEFTYTVEMVERSKTADVSWLTDPDHDLTLYCRSLYSMDYIAVRCDFAYN